MNGAGDAVRLLGSLGATDRRWILDRLPASARARLAEQVDAARDEASAAPAMMAMEPLHAHESLPDVEDDFEWRRCVARLSAANPATLAQVLQSEPAWLIDALLHAADWPWREPFRKSLPAAVRAELTALERSGARLGAPATQTLVRELAARAADWPLAPPPPSGLRGILKRLRGGGAR
jgi:hypothetical protein